MASLPLSSAKYRTRVLVLNSQGEGRRQYLYKYEG